MSTRKEDKNRRGLSGHAVRHGGAAAAPRPLSPTLLGATAAFLAALLYLPAVQYGWVWDDSVLISAKGAGSAATEGFRPFASFLNRAEWAAGYGSPGLFHFTSLALHGVVTWLVFLFARRVGAKTWVAFGVALLFGVHPVHTEAVAYVSGRPDLLATLFALASLLVATSAPVCGPGGCRNWRVWPAYGLFALAALTEEVALITPFVLVLLDRITIPARTWRERRVVYAGFFGVLVAAILARIGSGGTMPEAHGEVPAGTTLAAPLFAAYDALRAFVAPWDLSALRSLSKSIVTPGETLWRAAVVLVPVALLVWWRRRDPLARAGIVLLAVPLLPALPLPLFEGPYLMERALYFSSVGFCLLVGSVAGFVSEWIPGRARTTTAILVTAAAVLAVVTLARLPVWRDNVALLRAAAAYDPKDPKPHLLLAEHFVALGDPNGALAAVERAIAIDPKNADAFHKQTAVLTLLGQYPQAEAAARTSISLDPKDAIGWANLGDALMQQGKSAEAIDACRRAVALDSTNADNWYNLGVALGNQDDLSEAIAAYRRTIEINPRHAQAVNNMGALLGASGRIAEARDAYKRAVQLTPMSVEVRMNLALAYLRLGDRTSAKEQRTIVERLDPAAVKRLDEIFRASGVVPDAPSEPSRRP